MNYDYTIQAIDGEVFAVLQDCDTNAKLIEKASVAVKEEGCFTEVTLKEYRKDNITFNCVDDGEDYDNEYIVKLTTIY